MSKNHITQNNEELKELFHEDGRLKKLDELQEKDLEKIKSTIEKITGYDLSDRNIEPPQFEYIYEGIRQATNVRPNLLDKMTVEIDGRKVERINLTKFVKGFSDRPLFSMQADGLAVYNPIDCIIYFGLRRVADWKKVYKKYVESGWFPKNTNEYAK
jgi:hypothetical protein